LLEPREEALVPAATEPFVVRDRFKTGAGVKFSTVWAEFKSRFFGKIEPPSPAFRMRKYKLLAFAPDGPIIAELGGEANVESSLRTAFALLQRQGNGEEGFLQTNGFANIFYVRDLQGVLCAIRIGWADAGWVVDAIPVADPLAWNGKHEIFCPVREAEPATANLGSAQ
jgi:hypothetical protein